mgnify:FL=1
MIGFRPLSGLFFSDMMELNKLYNMDCMGFRPLSGLFFSDMKMTIAENIKAIVSVPSRGYFFPIRNEQMSNTKKTDWRVSVPSRGYFFPI